MDIFNTYAVDENKELNGTLVSIGDSKFLVARAGNKPYVKMLGKEVEKHDKALNGSDEALKDYTSDSIMIDVLATTILLGWENVSYKGEPMEYSKENAKTLLGHKEFRRDIMRLADNFSSFKAEQVEAAVKN